MEAEKGIILEFMGSFLELQHGRNRGNGRREGGVLYPRRYTKTHVDDRAPLPVVACSIGYKFD